MKVVRNRSGWGIYCEGIVFQFADYFANALYKEWERKGQGKGGNEDGIELAFMSVQRESG